MHTRTPRALGAAAALALLAGACTDIPTTDPTVAPGERASLSAGAGPALVSNAVKYRDTGGRAATGRSGNAVVDALALVDVAGTTTLYLAARHATEGDVGGTVERVQVKAFSPDGDRWFTRNVTPAPDGSAPIQGLARGDQVQLQAHVTGVDPNRTDVVTVTERVKRLPDLRVSLTAPPEAETNTPVNVLAIVTEANGDVGTHASCELYVDGTMVDVAHGIWVDAGDAVSCAFTHEFDAAGAHTLEVRASPTVYGDWNPADNAATATITLRGASAQFYSTAFFDQTTTVDSSAAFDTWRDGLSGLASEYQASTAQSVTNQSAQMYGYMPAPVGGPAVVRVSMSTGGQGVHAAEWTYTAADLAAPCLDRVDGRAIFWLCSFDGGGWGTTSFTYAYAAGAVTYHGQGYSRFWDDFTGTDFYVYHWNDVVETDEGPVAPGGDWTIDVRVIDAAGEHVGAHALQLTRSVPWEQSYPYTCTTFDQPEWLYSRTYCSGSMSRTEHVSGFAAG